MTQNTTLSERETLKPCPFCGSAPVVRETIEHYAADDKHPSGTFTNAYLVMCDECGTEQAAEYKSEAFEAWNRRGPAVPAEPVAAREFIENWFAPWGSWKTAWWEMAVSDDVEMTEANALVAIRKLLATPAQPSTVPVIQDEDIPALLRAAIRRLEAYDAPSRPDMLDLASHLRGVLEIPHDAEEAVRRCASIDSNSYIAEKSSIIAALRASKINSPPATSPVTGALVEAVQEACDALKIEARANEMSANIMRDPARTGRWPGAERTASAFDRHGLKAAGIRAKLLAALAAQKAEG